MRLVLSSAVAPERPLDDLLDAAARKAVAGLELEAGHAHGVGASRALGGVEGLAGAAAAFRARDLTLAGLRIRAPLPPPAWMAGASRALGAPLIVDGGTAGEDVLEAALRTGARVLLAFDDAGSPGWPAAEALRRCHGGRVGFAWDARPSRDPAGAALGEVLGRTGPALRHVRLHGAGPEGCDLRGGSVGALMGRLTLARFDGTCALAPSGDDRLPVWGAWLGRRRGWGCNGDRPVQIEVRGKGCGCR